MGTLEATLKRVRDRMERDTRGQTHDGSETGTGAWWTRQSYDDLRTILADHARLTARASVPGEVYEAAVKGRQDFRLAYRKMLPVLRAAETICRLWRSPQRPFQVSDEFADAINALDVSVTGGGAKPDWSHTTAALSPSPTSKPVEAEAFRDGWTEALRWVREFTTTDQDARIDRVCVQAREQALTMRAGEEA